MWDERVVIAEENERKRRRVQEVMRMRKDGGEEMKSRELMLRYYGKEQCVINLRLSFFPIGWRIMSGDLYAISVQ